MSDVTEALQKQITEYERWLAECEYQLRMAKEELENMEESRDIEIQRLRDQMEREKKKTLGEIRKIWDGISEIWKEVSDIWREIETPQIEEGMREVPLTPKHKDLQTIHEEYKHAMKAWKSYTDEQKGTNSVIARGW